MPATDLVIAGNGPGELTGWIAPVARAARRLAAERARTIRLTLALSPSQFAGGREREVVHRWGLFDAILSPAEVTRLALRSGGRVIAPAAGCLIHLGGDLWISARLARSLRLPAAALAETTRVAARHRHFQRVFAVSDGLAADLIARSVPASKVIVTGDPRSDTVLDHTAAAEQIPRAGGAGYRVSFLAGSRDRFFSTLVPYFAAAADTLANSGIAATVQFIVSEFLSPAIVDAARDTVSARWPHLAPGWITHDPWAAIAGSDLVVTIPGTNTLELAMAGVPFVVVVDEALLHIAPIEGAAEWLTRLPGLSAVRTMLLHRVMRQIRFAALPNAKAGRMVVPEWVGRWTPSDLAKRVADLLQDTRRRETIRAELLALGLRSPGAARRIAEAAFGLAEGTVRQR